MMKDNLYNPDGTKNPFYGMNRHERRAYEARERRHRRSFGPGLKRLVVNSSQPTDSNQINAGPNTQL